MSNHPVGSSRWASLERARSTLFFIAGGLLAILTALWALEVFTNTDTGVLRGVIGPAGMGVAFLGMLGLYPSLVDRTPWVARAGALFASLGIVGMVARVIAASGQLVGIYDATPAWVTPFTLPFLIGIVLGFITFGVAIVRTDVYPRTVGLLLMIPGILFPVVLATVIVFGGGDFPYVIHVIHNGTDTLVFLGVGYLLRLQDALGGQGERTPDMAGG